MGVNLFDRLGFSIDLNISSIRSVNSWQSHRPSLFAGLGKVQRYCHAPTVAADVKPVMQPLRRLPFTLKDEA